MKKVVFLYLFSTFCAAAFAAKPPKIKVEKVDPDTTNIVQYRTRANHWSLSATFGAGYLDGDQIKPNQRVTPIASQGVMKFNFTVNAEYTFSPIWGMY
ncbi:MAG: hypothetical protein LBS50_04820, partial [Prevotellaceae bacterium]|nr:hypothetical protein [Prevotellaceae bacterium]